VALAVVRESVTSPAKLDLEALEVRLVLLNLDERLWVGGSKREGVRFEAWAKIVAQRTRL
jgi:hypothetical protein